VLLCQRQGKKASLAQIISLRISSHYPSHLCAVGLRYLFLPQGGIPVAQLDQNNMSSLEEMVRQLQDSMKAMQQDTVRQAEFAKQQAVVIAQQADTIARLE